MQVSISPLRIFSYNQSWEQKTNYLLLFQLNGQIFSSSFSLTVQLFESPNISRSPSFNLCTAGARVRVLFLCGHSNPDPQPSMPQIQVSHRHKFDFFFLFFLSFFCSSDFLFVSLKLSYVFIVVSVVIVTQHVYVLVSEEVAPISSVCHDVVTYFSFIFENYSKHFFITIYILF